MYAQGIEDRCIRFDTHHLPQIHLLPISPANVGEDPGFQAFLDCLHGECEAVGPLESLIADRISRAAYRLSNFSKTRPDLIPSEAERADEDCLFRGLQALNVLRSRRAPAGWAPTRSHVLPDMLAGDEAESSGELSALPIDLASEDEESDPPLETTSWDPQPLHAVPISKPSADSVPHQAWRERLQFNPRCSHTSPVVRNTNVTVGHVVSLIIDGWSWADIMRSHPELVEDDIRACLAFTLEEEPDDFAIPPAAHAVAVL